MVKKKQDKQNIFTTRNILFIIIGILILLLLLVSAAYISKLNEKLPNNNQQAGSIAQLGIMEYTIKDGKANKRTDEHITKLKEFLIKEGNKSLGPDCRPVHHNVVAASPDERQVLLDYGCGVPGSKMFAVQLDGTWKTLSPTNQFDLFGIPNCEHVNANNIDRSIAPVCAQMSLTESEPLTYKVR